VNAAATDRLRVTLVKSLHGQLAHIAASVRGLGLRRRHQSVSVANTPEIRGMIRAAEHLLKVEESEPRQDRPEQSWTATAGPKGEAHGGSRA
jgi:large subunit ribosomal protein L30